LFPECLPPIANVAGLFLCVRSRLTGYANKVDAN
jgi:hypothetical protein